MESLLVGLVLWFLGVVMGVIGNDRIRRWVRLDEPEPYFVVTILGKFLDDDPVVGPLLKAERDAG